MTDSIIVDAVENAFVPLLIHNNQPGEDTAILKKYREPAWNYQVIRFLDHEGQDVIPRKDQINTRSALIPRMVLALEKAKRPIPAPLKLSQLSLDTTEIKSIAFSQHCFWTGEAKLGTIPGVLTTEAGWIEGHEVTLIRYHQQTISTKDLIRKARDLGVANDIYSSDQVRKSYRKAKAADQKKQIQGTAFANLDLSPEQTCKVNAFCRTNPKKAMQFLTAKQRQRVQSN